MSEQTNEAVEAVEVGGGAGRRHGLRRRRRVLGGRQNQVNAVFTDEEFVTISARASAQRMTVPHYLAHVGLAGGQADARVVEQHQMMLHEVVMMRAQVRRVGQNVNQVLRLLQGTGEVARGAGRVFTETEQTMVALREQAARWVPSGLVDDVPEYRA